MFDYERRLRRGWGRGRIGRREENFDREWFFYYYFERGRWFSIIKGGES